MVVQLQNEFDRLFNVVSEKERRTNLRLRKRTRKILQMLIVLRAMMKPRTKSTVLKESRNS